MLYARSVRLPKDVAYPLKPSSSQATKLYPGKARSYEPNTLNETMLPMRTKKRLTIPHTSTGSHSNSQPKRKNGDVRKKETHTGSKKK